MRQPRRQTGGSASSEAFKFTWQARPAQRRREAMHRKATFPPGGAFRRLGLREYWCYPAL